MVHVSNGEGHRKMLAFSRSQHQTTGTPPSSNLNHIILTNSTNPITKSCLKDPSSTGSSYILENHSNNGTVSPHSIPTIPGSVVGPLPSYKSNSLNLSCIVEEEPPPGMMMSHIRETASEPDNNANVNVSITTSTMTSTADSNRNSGDGRTVVTTTTELRQENRVFTEEVLVSPSGKNTKKRVTSTESRVEELSSSQQQHESPRNSGTPKSPARVQEELLISQSQGLTAAGGLQSPTNGNATNANTSANIPNSNANENQNVVVGTPSKDSPPHSAVRHPKLANGAGKTTGLKRVSFGSSKGSMVETLIFDSPVSDERRDIVKTTSTSASVTEPGSPSAAGTEANDAVDAGAAGSGGSTGGSRPPSRVRVTFFESEKPLAVSSPESDNFDFDLNMTLPGSPNAVDSSTISYNRQMSTESGWDNPFRPDGDLSKEADQIVELIKEGKPINDETLRSKSPSVNEMMNSTAYSNILNASTPGKGANGVNGSGLEVQRGVVVPASQAAGQVEHVTLKKKKGCCVIQ